MVERGTGTGEIPVRVFCFFLQLYTRVLNYINFISEYIVNWLLSIGIQNSAYSVNLEKNKFQNKISVLIAIFPYQELRICETKSRICEL